MTNRIREQFGEPERERPPASDYFVVAARYEEFYVPRQTAERLLDELAAERPPRWLRFTDVQGARVAMRSRLVEHVRECTEAQRAAARAFRRARRREAKADRTWDDDEFW